MIESGKRAARRSASSHGEAGTRPCCASAMRAVRVCAACRLHFGMFSFGQPGQPEFGGVGVMIEPPSVQVDFLPAPRFAIEGDLADRASRLVRRLAARWNLPDHLPCNMVIRGPREHTGLGVGTPLSLAIAAGLRRLLQLPPIPIEQLALDSGRGTRSAVGTHGFQHGGLIVDTGKTGGQSLGSLGHRFEIPAAWRFVLICPTELQGLAGKEEAKSFALLPRVPKEVTERLREIVTEVMLPAIQSNDCLSFGNSVYDFGRLAGECFAAAQGGPYASPRIEQLVEWIRSRGIAGVGQSSWGPTVFAATANQAAAEQLAEEVKRYSAAGNLRISIGAPCNHGATVVDR
ncbi:MAG: hypothetical protein IT425_12745 [Pirellulales bacterium]|nr:hypothetical protein [Pirellulales bacterium]